MEQRITLDVFHLLIFTIPGFFVVWSYNKAKGKKIESDFEYLVFSFFWGLFILALLGWIMPKEKFDLFFKNIYAATIVLSLINIIFGNILGGRLDKYIDSAFSLVVRKARGK
jgi:RsiW-degrading membrane proteinase PrsW (M82 family)